MYTTLSINNNSIRILAAKGKKACRWGAAELAEGLVRDGLITQPKEVGETINNLFATTKLPREKVIVSISGLSFTYRFLTLPRLKPALLEENIRRSFKKEISLPLEELYLAWQPLPGEGDEPTYFVLGVSRYLVDALVKTLEIAGVEPYIMDIQPLALARVANRGSAIIVSLEPECYDIVIVADGTPAVMHTVTPRGGGATLEDNIKRLADELTKTIAFYQSHNPKGNVPAADTPMLLTGKLAEEIATQGLLQATTEYNIEPLAPAMACPSDIPTASYAANIGLALKKLPQKKPGKETAAGYHDIDINLLAEKRRKPQAPPLPTRSILLGVLLAIAVVLLYPLYQGKLQTADDNAFLSERFQRISRELNLAGLVAEEAEITESIIAELSLELEMITNAQADILGTRGELGGNLTEIYDSLPPGLYLKSFEADKGIITVEGETDSVFKVITYAAALEATGAFSLVRITSLDEDSALPADAGDDEEPVTFITFTVTIS
jgi:Tfp pilus assembly PilM family ATPase/Tfp pilus assembly protein PilN